jgi:DNA replication protein DnaC
MNVPAQQLKAKMDDLGLEFMAAGLETFLSDPAQSKKNLIELFTDLMELESIPRKERSARSRLKLSGIPHHKSLEDFDVAWVKGGITEAQISELGSLSFVSRKQNVILMGPSGLGKTHLMCAIEQKACRNGYTAYYTTCTELMENLTRARENNRLRRKLTWFRKPHVLLIDEVGNEHLNQDQANLFFSDCESSIRTWINRHDHQ